MPFNINSILQKCLDELGKEKADLSYIKGMLEVLLATQPQQSKQFITPAQQLTNVASNAPVDEASILDAKARAALETVKALGGKTE